MEFLTPGEKVKKIRKMLKIKQRELQDENITRGFISMIESNRSRMSIDTAKKIAKKFNERAKELGINLNINGEYLLLTPNQEAEKYCFEKLNNNIELEHIKDINEIIEISEKYELTEIKIKAYIKRADLEFENHIYKKAFLDYHEALDILVNIGNTSLQAFLYNKLGRCKINEGDYIEALTYFNKALYYSLQINDLKTKKNAIYNIALCYKKLNKFDAAFEYIDEYLSLIDKNEEFTHYVYINILKANCYKDKKEYEKAINLYQDLIKEVNDADITLVGYIYSNLAEIYLEQSNFDKSLECFNIAEKIRRDNDMTNLHHTLIDKANVYIKNENYNEALKLLEEGINLSYRNNDIEYILRGNYMLTDIYKHLDDNKNLNNTYMKIIDVLENVNNEREIIKIFANLSLMNLEQGNAKECKDYLNKIIEKINQNEHAIKTNTF
ncbi:helix-turn-helix domain-containing protein [Thermoanaerobacterium thermosaccharolyticum]|uniref:helix-turn-helix domain-containing protein n=1 Tax=Thermoanaerobacterium thermosaccharolyticum TaxID=1517 RepID=UPI00123BF029|nr:helix-turn-helix domain-containing protein [Thermoanaerobacterium thermosaccharolyticum]KAA5806033.1 tetratricopeptide repeat protein [Thermoanaerobacterium thermosaccharolyticum]